MESLGKSDIDVINGTHGPSQLGPSIPPLLPFPSICSHSKILMSHWGFRRNFRFLGVRVLFILPEAAFFLLSPWFPFKSHLLWSLLCCPGKSLSFLLPVSGPFLSRGASHTVIVWVSLSPTTLYCIFVKLRFTFSRLYKWYFFLQHSSELI